MNFGGRNLMKLVNKIFKSALALLMLATPLSVYGANEAETTPYENPEPFSEFYDESYSDVQLEETEFDLEAFNLEPISYNYANSEQAIPAVEGYVPEMLFVDDTLLAVEEDEIFESITPLTTGSTGSGLVQFVLEPVQSSLPSGVTMAQARAAAFNARTVYHSLFATATATNSATSINGSFGRDALFLGNSADGNRFRVLIAGFEGYVNRVGHRRTITVSVGGSNRTFDVTANAVFVPFGSYPSAAAGSVHTASHYVNRNGELFRYLTNNAATTGGFTRFLTGPAPSWMSQNVRYYSYDGVYFYRNPRHIRVNGSGAVNANNPFFNYFQYLSFRSHSTVTASQLNNFITNQSLHPFDTSNSVMLNQGNAFVNAQNRYGVNALLMYAKAVHESAGGTSSIARNNNNLFGLGAFDGDPTGAAHRFPDVASSVTSLADSWLSRGYLWPGDWRYAGPHVGHKGSGVNVRYATDPYWGQKIAGWAFRIDRSRSANTRDMNREQIAIRQNTAAVTVANSGGTTLYTANPRQGRYFPFLVTATASNNRLRILTDPAIVNGVANRTARFNRNDAVGFIPNSNVWFAGNRAPQSDPPTNPNHQITSMQQTGVTRQTATFRTGPGSSYSSIRSVRGNTNVRITGRTSSFYRVVIDGTTGWLRRTSVARTRQNAVVVTDNAHVRSGRGSSYSSLTQLARGHRVTVMRHTGDWSRVTANGHTGWIRNSDLRTGDAMRPGRTTANNVPVYSRPRTNSEIRHRLPLHTNLMIIQRTESSDGWTQIRISHNGGTLNGWVRTSQVQTRAFNRRTNRSATLRSGPGSHFRNLRTVPRNTTVTVRSRVGNWYHVHYYINSNRQYGWLNRENFSRVTLR